MQTRGRHLHAIAVRSHRQLRMRTHAANAAMHAISADSHADKCVYTQHAQPTGTHGRMKSRQAGRQAGTHAHCVHKCTHKRAEPAGKHATPKKDWFITWSRNAQKLISPLQVGLMLELFWNNDAVPPLTVDAAGIVLRAATSDKVASKPTASAGDRKCNDYRKSTSFAPTIALTISRQSC